MRLWLLALGLLPLSDALRSCTKSGQVRVPCEDELMLAKADKFLLTLYGHSCYTMNILSPQPLEVQFYDSRELKSGAGGVRKLQEANETDPLAALGANQDCRNVLNCVQLQEGLSKATVYNLLISRWPNASFEGQEDLEDGPIPVTVLLEHCDPVSPWFCFALMGIYSASALTMGSFFDKQICLMRSYEREPQEMIVVRYCDAGYEKVGNTCHQICREGFVPEYKINCAQPCPEGFKGRGDSCFSDYNYLMKALPYYSISSNCEKNHGKCGKISGWDVPLCVGGTNFDLVYQCSRKSEMRDYYDAKYGVGCAEGLEKIDGLCYSRCPSGAQGSGKACKGKCPTGYTQCGPVCKKGNSCLNWEVQEIEEFITYKSSLRIDFSNFLCP